VVIAAASGTIDDAAAALANEVPVADLQALDEKLQPLLVEQFGTLARACTEKTDRASLCDLLVKQAEEYLDQRLGRADAAEVFLSAYPDEANAAVEVRHAFESAAPALAAGSAAGAADQLCLLGVPPGPAGERFVELTARALPGIPLTSAAGGDEVVFVRERPLAALGHLPQLGTRGREAYDHDPAAAHARRDVTWRKPGK
jgi:hypothetical protein